MFVGAIIAFLLQVAIAPNLAIAGVAADVTLCFVVVNSMRVSKATSVTTGFALGALVDLACGTPLGVKALSYCLISYLANSISTMTMLDNIMARFVAIAIMLFCTELFTALLISIIGFDSGLASAFISRVLPAGLYDSVVALLFLPYASGAGTAGSGGLSGRLARTGRSSTPLKEKLPPL